MTDPHADVEPRSRPRLLAARVRRFREERGWTQAQLAARADLAPGTVSRIERGLDRPGGRTAAALARALGVEVDRLLDLAGQPSLFPAPDERRLDLLRRILRLSDDDLERCHPDLEQALARAEGGRPQAPGKRGRASR